MPPVIPSCEHIAGTERTMKKALQIQEEKKGRFDLTLDLEDGAEAGREKDHAFFTGELLRDHSSGFRTGIRIHGPHSEHWESDLDILFSLCASRLAYLTIPKVNGIAELKQVLYTLERKEREAGLPSALPVHVLIETQGALRDAFAIAAEPRVETLDFGLMDFLSSHNGAIPVRALKSPGQFEHPLILRARLEISAAAHLFGKIPVQNVTVDLSGGEPARQDAKTARELFGFLRMWSIHPVQIDPILEAMTPDHQEILQASEILLQAYRGNWGPIRYNDELHDRASFRVFWSLLKQARANGVSLPEEVNRLWFESTES